MSKHTALIAVLVLSSSMLVGRSATAADPPGSAFEDGLSAREIYRRVLENRFERSRQTLILESVDRAANTQQVRTRMVWARYDEGSKERSKGITSKTMIRYHEPSDVRGTGYLIINKLDAPNDQFVYLPSMRRVRRVNLRTEAIAGTDLGVEDIVPRELDDATYVRVADTDVDGTPCFAVAATPKPELESGYSKFLLLVEKEHYVPLRTRYWDNAGVEIKELAVVSDSIEQIEGVWLPRRSTMRHLVDRTHTDLHVLEIEPNPRLSPRSFSQRTLESKKLD